MQVLFEQIYLYFIEYTLYIFISFHICVYTCSQSKITKGYMHDG